MHPVDWSELLSIIERLLGPGGCPWDQAQTLASLRPHLIEEAYELDEALAAGSNEAIVDELGDVLMQVLLLSAKAEGGFASTLQGVVDGLSAKLVRRHPHVFAGHCAQDVQDAEAQWHAAKAKERKRVGGPLESLPQGLPALTYAFRLIEKATAHGLLPAACQPVRDAGALGDVVEQLASELATAASVVGSSEIETDAEAKRRSALVGKLLFEVVRLASAWNINAEHALRDSLKEQKALWGGVLRTDGVTR